jgi:transposase-like protein
LPLHPCRGYGKGVSPLAVPADLFCPNPGCAAYGVAGAASVRCHSRKEQRYRCTVCTKTFAATAATPFYRLHKTADLFTVVITLLSLGCPLQAVVVAFALDERTVAAWLRRAGTHAEHLHHQLVETGQVAEPHVQADELWAKLVGHRLWVAMALGATTKLWLGGCLSGTRDLALIRRLVTGIRACLADRNILVCVDGLASYVTIFDEVFRDRVPCGGPLGLVKLVLPTGFQLGQVIKQRVKYRLVSVTRRAVVGTADGILAVLNATDTGHQIHTAFIERLNATFRASLACLTRRGRALAKQDATLTAGLYLVGTTYNFCRSHRSLRQRDPTGRHRWRARTPAMAAGLTDHVWSVPELLHTRARAAGAERLTTSAPPVQLAAA